VFYNTGHGHLGWTLAAATAQMVADQIADTQAGAAIRTVAAKAAAKISASGELAEAPV
jgi:D-amino-acid dehydrogenase